MLARLSPISQLGRLSLVLFWSMSCLSVRRFSEFSVRDAHLTKWHSVRYIPEWLPWLSYKPLARIGHALGEELKNVPMQFVRENMVRRGLYIEHGIRAHHNSRSSMAQQSIPWHLRASLRPRSYPNAKYTRRRSPKP